MSKRNVVFGAAISVGIAVLGSLAPHVGAKPINGGGGGGVVTPPVQAEPNHFVTSTRLQLVGGEDPNAPTNLTPGFAAAGTLVNGGIGVRLDEMDASRFPASVRTATGTVAPCVATLSAGSLSGTAPVIADPRNRTRTSVQLLGTGTLAAGDQAAVDVVCNWTDRKGALNHHETHWAGTL